MSSENGALGCLGRARRELPSQVIAQLASHEQGFRAAGNGLATPRSNEWPTLEKAALVRVRRDQATLSDSERQAFNRALQAMVEDGTYEQLTRLKCDRSHNMTGDQGVTGLHRFLPWHRRCLWEFETRLQRIDCRLRPNDLPMALPYWNWSHPLPTWLTNFSDVDDAAQWHAPASSPLKPTHQDIWLILHGFSQLLPTAGVSDYVKFTYALEGWASRPDRTPLPGHNQVLDWLEHVLRPPAQRPMHPIFWLHLAQVDRLWCLWQAEHPGSGPALAGSARLLDPWPQTADEMLNPESIGYAYDV